MNFWQLRNLLTRCFPITFSAFAHVSKSCDQLSDLLSVSCTLLATDNVVCVSLIVLWTLLFLCHRVDVRLNPGLMKSCMTDITKHCNRELDEVKGQNVESQGRVMFCLRRHFAAKVMHHCVCETESVRQCLWECVCMRECRRRKRVSVRECRRVSVRESWECVCESVSAWESVGETVCLCVCESVGECVCGRVSVRECLWECVCERVCLCVCETQSVCLWESVRECLERVSESVCERVWESKQASNFIRQNNEKIQIYCWIMNVIHLAGCQWSFRLS